jgi:hypothetical protein
VNRNRTLFATALLFQCVCVRAPAADMNGAGTVRVSARGAARVVTLEAPGSQTAEVIQDTVGKQLLGLDGKLIQFSGKTSDGGKHVTIAKYTAVAAGEPASKTVAQPKPPITQTPHTFDEVLKHASQGGKEAKVSWQMQAEEDWILAKASWDENFNGAAAVFNSAGKTVHFDPEAGQTELFLLPGNRLCKVKCFMEQGAASLAAQMLELPSGKETARVPIRDASSQNTGMSRPNTVSAISGDLLAVGSSNAPSMHGEVALLNLATGEKKWAAPTYKAKNFSPIVSLAAGKSCVAGHMIFGHPNQVWFFGLNLENGQKLWGPLAVPGLSGREAVTAYCTATGGVGCLAVKENVENGKTVSLSGQVFPFDADRKCFGNPVVIQLPIAERAPGRFKSEPETCSAWFERGPLDEELVIVDREAKILKVVALKDGKEAWSVSLQAAPDKAPQIADDVILISCGDKALAFDRKTGAAKGAFQGGSISGYVKVGEKWFGLRPDHKLFEAKLVEK